MAVIVNRRVGEDAGGTGYIDLPAEVASKMGNKGVVFWTDHHVVGHDVLEHVRHLGEEDLTMGVDGQQC